MEIMIYLVLFLVFCWAIFATVFAFQLYRENEDFARRLGRSLPQQNIKFYDYLSSFQNKVRFVYNELSLNTKYYIVGLAKLLKLIPLKIRIK